MRSDLREIRFIWFVTEAVNVSPRLLHPPPLLHPRCYHLLQELEEEGQMVEEGLLVTPPAAPQPPRRSGAGWSSSSPLCVMATGVIQGLRCLRTNQPYLEPLQRPTRVRSALGGDERARLLKEAAVRRCGIGCPGSMEEADRDFPRLPSTTLLGLLSGP
ncbi:unnamed protein product [Boreogadus saida]